MGVSERQKSATKVSATRRKHIQQLNLALAARNQAEICQVLLAETKRQRIMRVAERMGTTRGSLYSALGPHGNPTLAMMLRLADALNLTVAVEPGEQSPDA